MRTKTLTISALLVAGLLLAMSLASCKAEPLQLSNADVNEIYLFIILSIGILTVLLALKKLSNKDYLEENDYSVNS